MRFTASPSSVRRYSGTRLKAWRSDAVAAAKAQQAAAEIGAYVFEDLFEYDGDGDWGIVNTAPKPTTSQ